MAVTRIGSRVPAASRWRPRPERSASLLISTTRPTSSAERYSARAWALGCPCSCTFTVGLRHPARRQRPACSFCPRRTVRKRSGYFDAKRARSAPRARVRALGARAEPRARPSGNAGARARTAQGTTAEPRAGRAQRDPWFSRIHRHDLDSASRALVPVDGDRRRRLLRSAPRFRRLRPAAPLLGWVGSQPHPHAERARRLQRASLRIAHRGPPGGRSLLLRLVSLVFA